MFCLPLRGQQANDKPPAVDRYSGEPHIFVSADTRQKTLSVKPEKVFEHLNLLNLDLFRISILEFRISC